jgi:hypothetical protein
MAAHGESFDLLLGRRTYDIVVQKELQSGMLSYSLPAVERSKADRL